MKQKILVILITCFIGFTVLYFNTAKTNVIKIN